MGKKNGLVRRAGEEKRMDSNKIYLHQLKCNLLNKCIKKTVCVDRRRSIKYLGDKI